MTEDEAKLKWCPFARPGQVRPEDCGEIRGNRMMNGDVDTGALCVGSACMAWRTVDVERFYPKNDAVAKVLAEDGWDVGNQGTLDGPLVATRGGGGLCGLAS